MKEKEIVNLIYESEQDLRDIFKNIDDVEYYYSSKVLKSFHDNNVSETDFNGTTGYGYNDVGRDKIERIFASIFDAESSLVRNQFISGSHALTVALFAILRPKDILLSITGTPYDTLQEVIGIRNNPSSLKSFDIKYQQIDLVNNDFNYNKIKEYLRHHKVKVIHIQLSRGYSIRATINNDQLKKVVELIKSIDKKIIVLVDNCYCEMVTTKNPIVLGADIAVGSLIKNLGGGIASNGAYIVGKNNLINLCAERLNLPGEGINVGPSMNANKMILQGLYLAPSVVSNALKVAILTSKVMTSLGYEVSPKYNDIRYDIVETITFNDEKKLIKYANGIQHAGAIDSNVNLIPSVMPGYENKIIMASPSFTSGSSIEISCDGPLISPYILFQQGSLTYNYGKIALINAIKELHK